MPGPKREIMTQEAYDNIVHRMHVSLYIQHKYYFSNNIRRFKLPDRDIDVDQILVYINVRVYSHQSKTNGHLIKLLQRNIKQN